jgi:hypothetical protein
VPPKSVSRNVTNGVSFAQDNQDIAAVFFGKEKSILEVDVHIQVPA